MRTVPSQGDAGLSEVLVGMVASGNATAASALLWRDGAEERAAIAGWSRPASSRPLAPGNRFDLASLTKPVHAAVALRWDARGELPLTTRLSEIWPRPAPGLAGATLEDLLRHRAGFARWAPLFALCADRAAAVERLLDGSLLGAAEPTYSDLDYVLWGLSAERALGEPLPGLVRRELDELGPEAPVARPAEGEAVECLMDGSREAELAADLGVSIAPGAPPRLGEVQDRNARFLGGLGGHAGLFASAAGLARVIGEWMRPSGWLTAEGVERALREAPFTLGWTRPAAWRSVAGGVPAGAFGHLGFTGGSVWFERASGSLLVLLVHRVAPGADLEPWRRRLYAMLGAGAHGGQDGAW